VPIATVTFEGRYVPINTIPAGAIRIDGVWYLDPDKVPEKFKTERTRLPSFQAEVEKNGGILPPDMQDALKKQAEEVKKKSKNGTIAKDAQAVNVFAQP
jgi:hypothetical protein